MEGLENIFLLIGTIIVIFAVKYKLADKIRQDVTENQKEMYKQHCNKLRT